jgi:hypothetical protein
LLKNILNDDDDDDNSEMSPQQVQQYHILCNLLKIGLWDRTVKKTASTGGCKRKNEKL